MCGGASKILVSDLHIPDDLRARLANHGLHTAQDVLDEGEQSLRAIGCSETDVTVLDELIHHQLDKHIG